MLLVYWTEYGQWITGLGNTCTLGVLQTQPKLILNFVTNQQSHSQAVTVHTEAVTRLYTPPTAAAPPTPIKAAQLYLWCPSASHGPAGSGGEAAGRRTPASSGPAPAGPSAASPTIT